MNNDNLGADSTSAAMPHEPQALPMRWPFRLLAGILAFGIGGPFCLYIAFTKPLNGEVLAGMIVFTLQFASLSLKGSRSPSA